MYEWTYTLSAIQMHIRVYLRIYSILANRKYPKILFPLYLSIFVLFFFLNFSYGQQFFKANSLACRHVLKQDKKQAFPLRPVIFQTT